MIGKFKLKIDTVRAFFYKSRALFFDYQNRAGEASLFQGTVRGKHQTHQEIQGDKWSFLRKVRENENFTALQTVFYVTLNTVLGT